MTLEGGCQCGAVRYAVKGQPAHVALCHCVDCRKSSGAPVTAWAAYAAADFALLAGDPAAYSSNGSSIRHFCATCGTGLYFVNEAVLPGLVDIQVATLDDPDALPPQVHIQTAERVGWMESADALPAFARYPG
ncbi:GFA family protein [Novosphingobium sp. Leaf2]|uniref:GFA family protein n=1 Tax=Novosphingobium sp. Leaf2 TaxID=1735670 RepID=UPI0006FB879A|nr:GFA family protein [Novosphingobium sp. Leaf2]KQM18690.1 aldehyde-activating protein [Novosphingobium sp. Leaf2]